MKDKKKQKNSNLPAPYPATTSSEIRSRDIFNFLVDPKYIKTQILVVDKYPNFDGFLEITNTDQIPVAKFEVQLKTLDRKDLEAPKYQCTKPFLAACRQSVSPVLLIAVDQVNEKAYWLDMSDDLLKDIKNRIKGESCSVKIPVCNTIERNSTTYVSLWTAIFQSVLRKLLHFDANEKEKEQLKEQLIELQKRLQPTVSLADSTIREIHLFLDVYNYILDREFKVIRDYRFYDFWKIPIWSKYVGPGNRAKATSSQNVLSFQLK